MLENKYTVLLNFPSKFGTQVVRQQWEWSLFKSRLVPYFPLFSYYWGVILFSLLTVHKLFSYQIFNLFKKLYLQIRLRRSCFKYPLLRWATIFQGKSEMLYSKKWIFAFILTSWSAKLPYTKQSNDYRQHGTKYLENLKKYCEFASSSRRELTIWMWRKEKWISVLSYLHS